MPPSKPLPLWPYYKAGELLGHARLARALRLIHYYGWAFTPAGTPLKRVYDRLHARVQGRPPQTLERYRFLYRLAGAYADAEATKFTLDLVPAETRGAGVELPALAEIERLRRGGRGVVLASPHFGNLPLALTALGRRLPLSVVLVNDRPWRYLEQYGFKVLGLRSAAPAVMRALVANECVLLLADLDFFPAGRLADFFGAPVRPPHGLCRIADSAQAPILPIYAIGDSQALRVEADAPILPGKGGAQALEEPLLRSMERYIARYPSLWLVLRDIWDVKRSDAMNLSQLESIDAYEAIFGE